MKKSRAIMQVLDPNRCWHEPTRLDTNDGFFLALGLAKKKEWWDEFCNYKYNGFIFKRLQFVSLNLIDPTNFADALYEFLEETGRLNK